MFDLYQGHETAAHRQSELLDAVAADRLARLAREGHTASADDRVSPAHRVTMVLTDAVAVIRGAFHTTGRQPHWS